MIVEKRGNICQSTGVTQRERDGETERAIVLCLQAAIKKNNEGCPSHTSTHDKTIKQARFQG